MSASPGSPGGVPHKAMMTLEMLGRDQLGVGFGVRTQPRDDQSPYRKVWRCAARKETRSLGLG